MQIHGVPMDRSYDHRTEGRIHSCVLEECSFFKMSRVLLLVTLALLVLFSPSCVHAQANCLQTFIGYTAPALYGSVPLFSISTPTPTKFGGLSQYPTLLTLPVIGGNLTVTIRITPHGNITTIDGSTLQVYNETVAPTYNFIMAVLNGQVFQQTLQDAGNSFPFTAFNAFASNELSVAVYEAYPQTTCSQIYSFLISNPAES